MPTESTTSARSSSLPITRIDLYVAAAIFLTAAIVYIRTLAPDLLYGDSGEFQALSITGGLAHAFGYPVYLAFGKLFTYLPFGSIPSRVSLISALCASSAVAKTYLVGRTLKVRRVYSLFGAIALLISPLFWWQAIIAEVYTIGADFLIACILCCLIWRYTRQGWWLAAGGFLGGLCLGMHHVVLLITPFVIGYLLLCKAAKRDWLYSLGGVGLGVALSATAFVVMARIDSAPTSTNFLKPEAVSEFGLKSPEDFDNPLTRMKFVFFAVQFRGEFQAKHIVPNIPQVARETRDDFGFAIPILGLLGFLSLFKRGRRREALLLAGSYVVLLIIPMFFSAIDLEVEFVQAHLLMCILAALGLQTLQDLFFKSKLLPRKLAWSTAAGALIVLMFGEWAIIGGAWRALGDGAPTFLTGERRKFPFPVDVPTAPHELATLIVSSVPENAVLLTDWSYMDACYYVALFEQNKPQIQIIAPYPDVPDSPQQAKEMMSYYLKMARSHPLYTDKPSDAMDMEFVQEPEVVGQDTGKIYLYHLIPRHPDQ